ncbi:MAG: hypothetical protein OER88_14295 [Planctomycetota bacterium]|nr:hypothetical protein [Planctomycetota bacterium]
MVAINKIKPDYKGRADFEILDARSEAGKAAAKRNEWYLGPNHGLEIVRGDEVLDELPGHGYEEQHIRDLIDGVLQ